MAHSKKIAVFFRTHSFRSLGDELMQPVVRSLENQARRAGVRLEYFDRRDPFPEFVASGAHREYAAILGSIPMDVPADVRAWRRMERERPCVRIFSEDPSPSPHRHYVGSDEHGAMVSLLERLKKEGVRSAGFLAFNHGSYTRTRFLGFRDGCQRFGLRVEPHWIPGFHWDSGDWNPGDRRSHRSAVHVGVESRITRLIETSLSWPDRPEVLVCEQDRLAQRLLVEATRLGLQVPKDLCITGFDNLKGYLGHKPTITTVAQDFGRVARVAFRWALDLSRGSGDGGPGEILIPTTLVVRASTLRSGVHPDVAGDSKWKAEVDMALGEFLDQEAPAIRVAERLGLEVPDLHRRFRRVYGVSFSAHLQDRRLAAIARDLRETRKSITELYVGHGFTNHVYFNRLFRKKYGLTARAYRLRHQI